MSFSIDDNDTISMKRNVKLNTRRTFKPSQLKNEQAKIVSPDKTYAFTTSPVIYSNSLSDESSDTESNLSKSSSSSSSSDEIDFSETIRAKPTQSTRSSLSELTLPIIFELSEDNNDSLSCCSTQISSNTQTSNEIKSSIKDRKINFKSPPIENEHNKKINFINYDEIIDHDSSAIIDDSTMLNDKNDVCVNNENNVCLNNKNNVCLINKNNNNNCINTHIPMTQIMNTLVNTNGECVKSLTCNTPQSINQPTNTIITNLDCSNKSIKSENLLLNSSKRTPRFPMQKSGLYQKKPPRKPVLNDIVTDLDDAHSIESNEPSLLRNQMFKTYSKNQVKPPETLPKNSEMASKFNNNGNIKINNNRNNNNNNNNNSTLLKSQEISGSIVKMDKTINHVTNDIVRIDNVIERLTNFNRNFMSNLEQMSDAELSSVVSLQSNAVQTEPILTMPPVIKSSTTNTRQRPKTPSSSSSSSSSAISNGDSSTEIETGSSSDNETHVTPSPVHQVVPLKPRQQPQQPQQPLLQPRTVASIKSHNQALQHQDSDLSSLPESSFCEEPEKRNLVNQVQYFQRQIRKSAGQYKKPGFVDPPKKLVVDDKHGEHPYPKPRNSLTNIAAANKNRFSTSSSESSSNLDYNCRTLSNSNNKNRFMNEHSPRNSDDSGSVLSLNAHHLLQQQLQLNSQQHDPQFLGERMFQKSGAGASGRFNKNTKFTDKPGLYRNKPDDDIASISGKPLSSRHLNKNLLPHSRSYNSLNALHGPNSNRNSKHLSNNEFDHELHDLCDLIRQHLTLGNHEQIRAIFKALIVDNNRDRIEDIIDCFPDVDDRDILMQLATEVGFGLKEAESIFDMRMSRTDLYNPLRPGLSLSSLHSDSHQQHNYRNNLSHQNLGGERMVLWRADIEEMMPPAIKAPPKPIPTNLLKSAIISPESIAHVDSGVEQILQFDPTTFTELVSFLTKDCSNDVERVRALFRWITMYDMKFLSFDPAAPNESLIGVLRAIKCGQMTYNELFYHLCRYAGIQCQFISGYSKGAGYRPGMLIKDNRMFRNVWTAVFVAGAWRFVNCNWGARYLTSSSHAPVSNGTLVRSQHLSGTLPLSTASALTLSYNNGYYNTLQSSKPSLEQRVRCDEFYFLTDAKQHIFEHFPDKKQWQLLNRPISLEQFMALPIVKSPFFNANLSFKRNYAETLQTKNGKVTIKINMPRAVAVSCRLENSADNTVLRGLTLIQIVDLSTIVVTAAPSQPGKFYLSVYVSSQDDDWRFANDSNSSANMEMACSFQVHCSEHNYDRLVTGRFPEVGMLGPTPASVNMGVSINAGVHPFVVWDDKSTMKVNLALRPGLKVGHRMMSYDRSGQNSAPCDSYAILQRQPSTSSSSINHQYHLRFPVDAFYCLSIFASSPSLSDANNDGSAPATSSDSHNDFDEEDETMLMQCVYRLLVDCRRAADRIPPYPRQTSRWVNCRLIQPLEQHLQLSTRYRFAIDAPDCSAMAIVINDDPVNRWHDLQTSSQSSSKNSVIWKVRIDTGEELDRLSVYGRFHSRKSSLISSRKSDDPNELHEEFIKLLDYVLIPKLSK